jgi:guanylate kinase
MTPKMPNKSFGPNIPSARGRLAPICPPPQPLLILLSGLSGAGKDTVLAGLRKSGLPFYFSVSATTRKPRPGEKEGADYFFVSKKQFQQMIDNDELIEWANVYGNLYGRQKEPIRKALKQGQDVIVRLDVQGAAAYKKMLPEAVAIFMTTETIAELEERLKKRRTESAAELELRVKAAEKELKQLKVFDYIIVNRENELERAVGEVRAIIAAEKCRVSPRKINL